MNIDTRMQGAKVRYNHNIDDPKHTEPLFQIKDRAIVFDADTWNWQDVGDNSIFFKPATVVKIYKEKDELKRWLADVVFDDNPNKISRAHFQNMMKRIN